MKIYREVILDHYKNPRNHGRLEPADFESTEENVTCGDEISLTIKTEDPGELRYEASQKNKDRKIKDIKFEGNGCAISMASASLLTEKVKGMTVGQARALTDEDVLALFEEELTPARQKCALLGWQALQSALSHVS